MKYAGRELDAMREITKAHEAHMKLNLFACFKLA